MLELPPLERPGDPAPHARVLSNGRWTALATGAGTGGSAWRGLSVTRFDPTRKEPTSVKVLHDLSSNISGRLVIVVEGIRSAGSKIDYVDRFLRLQSPQVILHCALVQQKSSVGGPIPLHTRGFEIGDEFVVGYGLDLDERYRNLPYVAVLERRGETGATG